MFTKFLGKVKHGQKMKIFQNFVSKKNLFFRDTFDIQICACIFFFFFLNKEPFVGTVVPKIFIYRGI